MKATVIDRFGPPEVLRYADVADPTAGEGELVIKVAACGINRYDLYMRMGAMFDDIAFPHVLGADIVGNVAAIGAGVQGWREGDDAIVTPGYPRKPDEWDIVPMNSAPSFEVTGTHTWGGYAEYVRAPARWVVANRTKLPPNQAAAMPLVVMTAINAVKTLGEVTTGSRVLVQAGASGSGNACVQVARALGAAVATTVGSPEKLEIASQAGAELVINYNEQNFADLVLDWTDGRGVDAVIDNVGASVFEENLRCLRAGGIFVNFGLVGGIKATLNIRDLFFRRHQLKGSFMGSMDGFLQGLEMLAQGTVKAFVDRSYQLSDASAAHSYIDSRAVRGKVVLVV